METKRTKIEPQDQAVMEAANGKAGTKRTRVKPKFEDINNAPPATPDKEDLSKPFSAYNVKGTETGRLDSSKLNLSNTPKEAAKMPAGLDVEKAMVDAREAAPPKPKRARKPKAQEAAAPGTIEAEMLMDGSAPVKHPSEMTVDELAEELKEFDTQGALVIPADAKVEYIEPVEGGTSESPTKPIFKVLPGYEIVREPFHTNAPYTVVVRGQTGSRVIEMACQSDALGEAKLEHFCTARRISILRPGMKAVHFFDVAAFYKMRAQELIEAMAAGQARADHERAMRPQEVEQSHVRPQYGRRDYGHQNQIEVYDYRAA